MTDSISPISPPLSEETEQKKPVDTAQLRELSTFGASMGIGGKFLREICDEIDSLRAQIASSPPGHQTLPEKQALAWIERQVLRRVGTVTIGLTEDGNIGVWGPLQFNESDLCLGSGDTVLDAILAALPPEQNPTAPQSATTPKYDPLPTWLAERVEAAQTVQIPDGKSQAIIALAQLLEQSYAR